ncbi:Ribosome association toxin RatA [Candidatus Erwinia haradaeae]|uniref:Ribosome association toxin RatA n=1 Tax=Candidatus Erwinia haradaeae TaxID=1922217 RepID=A0A451DL95_9GAMM|nr:SRPBCC family protein [Candidatus Erwinia haradaeae]VFP87506.1 Ribosome association toxin RatA [Candidatus Erwinia haradaeae]
MNKISCSLCVPFSATKMYALVNDIDSYPKFLSGCISSRVLDSNPIQIIAAMDIFTVGIMRQTLVTRNILTRNHSIHIQLLQGPFRQLNGIWNFSAQAPETCQITFHLHVEFNHIFMELAFNRICKKLSSNLLKAFSQRASEVYAV